MVITTFKNRKSSLGEKLDLTWEELVDRLKTPVITLETLDEYQEMTNEQRTDIKDVGGYVCGEFIDNRRAKANIINRYVLAVDADSATDHDIEDYEAMYEYKYFVHTTHTSTPESPRYRWLFPLSRPVTSAEYRLLIAEVKTWVGADTIDETTDQPERLMFWPSVCVDVDYFYGEGGTSLLNPDDFITRVDDIPVREESSAPILVTDDVIPEGKRNETVFAFAADLRRQGLDKEVILPILELYNDAYCSPPLPQTELRNITRSVCLYTKGDKIPFYARDISHDFSDLGEYKKKESEEDLYKWERLSDILRKDIKPPEFLIQDLVSMGIGALTAPPKFGKSWLCMDMAICVATGTPFLGKKTTKCEVAYLALEDAEYRIQDRSFKVGGTSGAEARLARLESVDGVWVCRNAPRMTDGKLPAWLKQNIIEHPYVRFIIIDTLQMIRGESKRNEGVYGYDYRELSEIKKFADTYNLSILVVHHTKKGIDDSDFLSNMSGSNGISGVMDYAMCLSRKRRKDNTTLLDVTGRDTQPQSYIIQFNGLTYRWENLGEEKEVNESGADLAYVNDPLVKTVKYQLDKIEEAAFRNEDEDPPDEISWIVTGSELLDAIKKDYFRTDYTETNIGKRVNDIREKLVAKDGIYYEHIRVRRDGKQPWVHSFKRKVLA